MLRDRAFCSHICGRLVSNGRAAPAPPGLCFIALATASYWRARPRMRSQGSAAQRLTPRPHPRSLSPPTRTHRAGLALAERVRASKQWRDDDHADVCPDVGAALKASTCAEKARLSFRARSDDAANRRETVASVDALAALLQAAASFPPSHRPPGIDPERTSAVIAPTR